MHVNEQTNQNQYDKMLCLESDQKWRITKKMVDNLISRSKNQNPKPETNLKSNIQYKTIQEDRVDRVRIPRARETDYRGQTPVL